MDASMNEKRTASGTDWGLRAAPLTLLADYMRLGKWLDLRTDEGLVRRARIVEIRVYVQSEDIVLRQEWLEGDEFRHGQVIIDSEAIWKVLPSNYDISAVEPFGDLAQAVQAPVAAGVEQLVLETALAEALRLHPECEHADFIAGAAKTDSRLIQVRHAFLVAVWERTNLTDSEICRACGYRSSMPMNTAKWKVRKDTDGNYHVPGCVVAARNIGRTTDRILATVPGVGAPIRDGLVRGEAVSL